MQITAADITRFWSKVDRNGTGCWLWLPKSVDKDGYGMFWLNGKYERAHRVAWAIENGRWPESHVLHKCDNPPCCKPVDLLEGTQRQNVDDCLAKGRWPRGETHQNDIGNSPQTLAEAHRRAVMQIFVGPYGKCPDCKKTTPVRLNSIVAAVKVKEWSCDENLLKDVLKSVKEHSKDGRQAVKKKDAEGRVVKEVVDCKLAYCPTCTRAASRLYWLELDGSLSDPFCKYCLSQKVRRLESEDGVTANIPVYSYSTSVLSVQQALLVANALVDGPGIEETDTGDAALF